jgi:hypothetical protein
VNAGSIASDGNLEAMRCGWAGFAFVSLLVALVACNGRDEGISVHSACEVFCESFVACTVENAVDEDNVMQGCMNACAEQIDAVEADHSGDEPCEQAIREYYKCLGVEATCEQFESQMFGDQTCRSELFDLAELCENFGG